PRLERAYGLADGRWGHPEFGGGPAKAAELGDAEERLDAVERTLPDCEVLLHAPSRLSPIVGAGKRPYISVIPGATPAAAAANTPQEFQCHLPSSSCCS